MNKTSLIALGAVVVAAAAAGGYALYATGMKQGMGMSSAPMSAPDAAAPANESAEDATRRHIAQGLKAGDIDPATGQKILYYHDPMVPGNKFDRPAKSPFMDMMLYPAYAGGDGDTSRVTVSPRVQQNLGLRTAPVTEGMLAPQVSAVGSIAFNEREQVVVQARAAGFVERLHVRATLDAVAAGQPLAELYVPDWVAAQEEYLSVRRMQGGGMQGGDWAALVDAARQRMRQAGMTEAQIALVESSGSIQRRFTIVAPRSGVVTELAVREGMAVAVGSTLFRINGLASVWANAEVPESQAASLRPGAKVQARSPAVPGARFDGRVQALLPEVDAVTRTVKARLELANPGRKLVPGMFVQMQFMDPRAGKALLVPTEAVIQTGQRTLVMLAEDGGRFRPVEVEIGIESGGQTEVKRGLQAGQQVVVSSQFLIDSEASLRGIEARLNAEPSAPAASAAPRHQGEATIDAIGRDAMTLTHGPIPSLRWGTMTMDFKLPPEGLPSGIAAGARVGFEFVMDADNQPRLTSVTPLAPIPAGGAGSKP
jgi:Cu(I)/Ag(I) efflux system membrane fusion protein